MTNTDPTVDSLRANLEKGLKQLSIQMDNQQSTLLIQFLHLIAKWNRVHNLTAVRNIDEMVGRHILDSLSVLQWLPSLDVAPGTSVEAGTKKIINAGKAKQVDVLDVGTGAGLPVIPLAIARPDLQFLSIESVGKKSRFQQQAVLELELANVRVKQARIEDCVEQANTIVSRAFTAPDKFLQAVQKNCTDESQVIVMLGTREKMPDKLPVGFELRLLRKIDIPQCDSTRHVAICGSNLR